MPTDPYATPVAPSDFDAVPEAARNRICNGCGGKGDPIPVPQWHSRDTCNRHDFAYWIGGEESDRARADRELLNGMIRDAATRPWWQQPWYRLQAWIYYRSIRYRGRKHFHFGPKKTQADLAAFVAKVLAQLAREQAARV